MSFVFALDLEASFTSQHEIEAIIEDLVTKLWKAGAGVDIPRPFPRLTYQEAMARFGVDKPDLRFGMELSELSEYVDDATAAESTVLSRAVGDGNALVGLRVPGGRAVIKGQVHLNTMRVDFFSVCFVLSCIRVGG